MSVLSIIGNPNSGKTTLFNHLTGENERVGNRMGVTIEPKYGKYLKDKSVTLVDLPGTYSLQSTSKDQKVVQDYLQNTPPTTIINVVDGRNLVRHLFLSLSLYDLNVPTVIAINFSDQLKKQGVTIDAKKLSQYLGVEIVLVSANNGDNTDRLILCALNAVKPKKPTTLTGALSSSQIYAFLQEIVSECTLTTKTKSSNLPNKIDDILCSRVWGFLLFFIIIFVVYYLSQTVGGWIGGFIQDFFEIFSNNTATTLSNLNAPIFLVSLVRAVFNGVGIVLSFMPQILILFLLLGIMEETGYTSRVAFIFDRIFRQIGLGGKSVIPLVLSCGCTVTGLMTTRTIDGEDERVSTLILTPFMPCGAKMAVFSYVSSMLFNGNPLITVSIFFLSTFSVCVGGMILQKFSFMQNNESTFVLEIPPLKLPNPKIIFSVVWEKAKDFIVKAGTIILGMSVIVWFLSSFGVNGYTNGKITDSFIYYIGNSIKYLFYPLGFCSYQTSIAVLTGFMAKEGVIQVLSTLTSDLSSLFLTPFSAYGFLAFLTLSPPCIASLAVAKKELNGKDFVFMLVFQTLFAYIIALVINFLGLIFYGFSYLIFGLIVGIIVLISVVLVIKSSLSCKNCANCKRGCVKR